jgi:hypothetical protein
VETVGFILAFLIAFVTIFPIFAAYAVLRGWVLSILWGWFIVPLGFPALTIPAAIGLAIVISLLVPQDFSEPSEEDKQHFGKVLRRFALQPFYALLGGWIVRQFL